MSIDSIIAATSAGISLLAVAAAVWQAQIARQSADAAREQVELAKTQAEIAERQAAAAEEQTKLMIAAAQDKEKLRKAAELAANSTIIERYIDAVKRLKIATDAVFFTNLNLGLSANFDTSGAVSNRLTANRERVVASYADFTEAKDKLSTLADSHELVEIAGEIAIVFEQIAALITKPGRVLPWNRGYYENRYNDAWRPAAAKIEALDAMRRTRMSPRQLDAP